MSWTKISNVMAKITCSIKKMISEVKAHLIQDLQTNKKSKQ